MKKVKLLLMMIVAIMAMVCTGCNAKNDVTMTEEGKGTQVAKIGINKEIYTQEGVKVSNINDIANIVRGKIKNDAITITSETGSDVDYIVASFKFDTVEEMDKMIKKISADLDNLDMLYPSDFNVEEELTQEEVHIAAIKEYMIANNISFDEKSQGYTKFIKALEKAMENVIKENEETMGFFEDSADDERLSILDLPDEDLDEFLPTSITKGTNSSVLKVAVDNVNALSMYLYAIVLSSGDNLYDVDLLSNTIAENALTEETNLFVNFYEKINLASIIKNQFANYENSEEISIDDITDEQLAKIFNKSVVRNFDSMYDDVLIDEELSDDFNISDMDSAFEEMIIGLVDTIKFGKQTVSKTLNDLGDFTDEDGYLTIDSEKGLINPNNVNKTVDMDETPATADNFQLMLVAGIAVMTALLGVVFYIRRIYK